MITMTVADARRLGIVGLGAKKRRKYNNHPCEVDGHKFDSQIEAQFYAELLLRERAGEVESIEVHPRFVIVDADGHGPDIVYEADFAFLEKQGEGWEHIVCEVKSEITVKIPLYRLKARLFQARYPMVIYRVVIR